MTDQSTSGYTLSPPAARATAPHLTLYGENHLLILSSNSNNQVDMVRIDLINEIEIQGSPFKGKADAPVTIAVFDDYQ